MAKHKPITVGERFGRLVVLGLAERESPRKRNYLYECKCDCGGEALVKPKSLRTEGTRSCGCLYRETRITSSLTHGHSIGRMPSRTYRIWAGMIARCTRPATQHYPRYGGSGITVCERWMKFENFLADMGPRPPKKTLDRFPNKRGGYEPGNCRWATTTQQARNTSRNRVVDYLGRAVTLAELSELTGIAATTLSARARLGWTGEKLVKPPLSY